MKTLRSSLNSKIIAVYPRNILFIGVMSPRHYFPTGLRSAMPKNFTLIPSMPIPLCLISTMPNSFCA